jgi:hypothetical protein
VAPVAPPAGPVAPVDPVAPVAPPVQQTGTHSLEREKVTSTDPPIGIGYVGNRTLPGFTII